MSLIGSNALSASSFALAKVRSDAARMANRSAGAEPTLGGRTNATLVAGEKAQIASLAKATRAAGESKRALQSINESLRQNSKQLAELKRSLQNLKSGVGSEHTVAQALSKLSLLADQLANTWSASEPGSDAAPAFIEQDLSKGLMNAGSGAASTSPADLLTVKVGADGPVLTDLKLGTYTTLSADTAADFGLTLLDVDALISAVDQASAGVLAQIDRYDRAIERIDAKKDFAGAVSNLKLGLADTLDIRAVAQAVKQDEASEARYEFALDAVEALINSRIKVLSLFGRNVAQLNLGKGAASAQSAAGETSAEAQTVTPHSPDTRVPAAAPLAPTLPASSRFDFATDDLTAAKVLRGDGADTLTINADGLDLRQSSVTFWLVDAATNARVQRLTPGGTIDATLLSTDQYNIVAEVDAEVDINSARFSVDGHNRTENVFPFVAFGQTKNDYNGRTLTADPVSVRFQAFDRSGASGEVLIDVDTTFTIGAASTPVATDPRQDAFDAFMKTLDRAEREMSAPSRLESINAVVENVGAVIVRRDGTDRAIDLGRTVASAPTRSITADAAAVTAGSGDDRVLVTGGARVSELALGDGRNTVDGTGAGNVGRLIDGAGDSRVALAGDVADATLGEGDDVLSVGGRVVTADAGRGDDTIAASSADTLDLGRGDDVLTIAGTVGEVKADSGNDRVVVGGVSRTVDLGNGNDVFVSTRGAALNVSGGADRDVIELRAGGNADGGTGDDTFIYDMSLATGAATAFDGGEGIDTLRILADRGGVDPSDLDAILAELNAAASSGTSPSSLSTINLSLVDIERVEVVDLQGVVRNYSLP
ncbi:MAG: calcium-binding protein [Pseudomonadota bacterium]